MREKKHQGRFTIQFNFGDPQQARVSEILERQGRQKARFISTAILHYINCKETPEVLLSPISDEAEIEKIVLSILKKHTSEAFKHPISKEDSSKEQICLTQEIPSAAEHDDSTDELKALLGNGGFSAITNTLASFGRI